MSATSDDCIFCTIVAGEIPADVIGRSEHAIAFKDLNPQAPFHALVVPLDHHENVAASPMARRAGATGPPGWSGSRSSARACSCAPTTSKAA